MSGDHERAGTAYDSGAAAHERVGRCPAPVPQRIQLRHIKGWRMPPNTVKVDRTTKWGNPFNFKASSHCWTAIAFGCKGDPAGRHEASAKAYRQWVDGGASMRLTGCGLYAEKDGKQHEIAVSPDSHAPPPPIIDQIQSELGGKNLACWCALDKPCHADVLLELANQQTPPLRERPLS